jgi:hypothetical protein
MSEFIALPGPLSISLTTGDEFGMVADLDIDTTGFTWTAIIYETGTTVSFVNPGGVSTQGTTVATFVVTVVSAASGQLSLSLTEVQTAALNPATTYRWYLRGVSSAQVTKTYLSGTLKAYAP